MIRVIWVHLRTKKKERKDLTSSSLLTAKPYSIDPNFLRSCCCLVPQNQRKKNFIVFWYCCMIPLDTDLISSTRQYSQFVHPKMSLILLQAVGFTLSFFFNPVFLHWYFRSQCYLAQKCWGQARLCQNILGTSYRTYFVLNDNMLFMFLIYNANIYSLYFFRGPWAWPEPLLAYRFMPSNC